ncbi:MAG TPA: hypothetical protein VIO64_18270 [Pseudobacteroides sp.]|uniref:hypothetical protein n=1 Tax=Pseudobacteroides sp. TaxID=1968840 RepID=UPI002F932B60
MSERNNIDRTRLIIIRTIKDFFPDRRKKRENINSIAATDDESMEKLLGDKIGLPLM